MQNKTNRNSGKVIIAFAAMIVILFLAATNGQLAWEPLEKMISGEKAFDTAIKEVASNYSSDRLKQKDDSITINGLFARLTGRRVYNNAMLLKNGMLTYGVNETEDNIPASIERIITLSDFLQGKNIPFLYVQAPYKIPLEDTVSVTGTQFDRNSYADRTVTALTEHGTNVLDLRQYLSRTQEDIERYFYRTDHHWNPDAALIAGQYIVSEAGRISGERFDTACLDEEKWERHKLPNWWLGTHGKRVGPLFAGTDSLIWLTPKYDTKISYSVPGANAWSKGSFDDVFIQNDLTEQKDYYHLNHFTVYRGSEAPLLQLKNYGAANDKKVLILAESFSIPLKAYLSTVFTEVDTIDPRQYTTSSIAEYIDWCSPDMVLLICNPSQINNKAFVVDYGCDDYTAWQQEHTRMTTVLEAETILIPENEGELRLKTICENMMPGSVYHLEIRDIDVVKGDTEAVTALLLETTKKKAISRMTFDVDYKSDGGYHAEFKIPQDGPEGANYVLQLYAGRQGHLDDYSVKYSGVSVIEQY